MSKMMCQCGHIMGTSECPSPYSVAIYYAAEIEEALREVPEIHLADFLNDWDERHQCQRNFMKRSEPVDYWYCTECHRIYEAQCKPYGRWVRIYQRIAVPTNKIDFHEWSRIYVMPDIVTDAATEKDYSVSLADFLKQRENIDPIYYLSPDEKTVHAQDQNTGHIVLSYCLEASWSPDNSEQS